jgi:hypothetical protein
MSLDMPFTETLHQPIVIRRSKWKLLLLAAVSLAFVAAGIWMMHNGQNANTAIAAVIFFGLCLLVFLALMFMPSLLLTIDDEGIHSHYPFWRPLTIRWEEIACIRPIKIRFRKMFTVDVSPVGKQTYIARNFKAGKIPFNMRRADASAIALFVTLRTATLSYTQAIAQIQERYATQIAQYQILIYEK